ncbi:hypothetical protein P3X46_025485 [Hevea brasiliensis]|uniref:SAUR family protein n=1 Tax=Hevea brasiliensis TaxID=3981 RepID=A0ABQ9L931_HEVBR|nr:auxin-responsive protein SAUR62-like [Hevea brasiliensis]KAJ9160049.1 hypothetical protein P3X46_025485 [Hevea brasiliensis]
MISAKKLLNLARKWQKLAAISRKRITLPQTITSIDPRSPNTPIEVKKGHFIVYSVDKKRFLLPLEYLNNEIIRELFNMAEEEFGLPATEYLTLTCDAKLMEYVITLIKQNVTRDVERALLTSIASGCFSSSLHLRHQPPIHQLPICSF